MSLDQRQQQQQQQYRVVVGVHNYSTATEDKALGTRQEMGLRYELLSEKINYRFNNRGIAYEALQLAGNGVTRVGSRDVPNGNKRLAVLGNLVLETVLCSLWMESGRVEAEWTETRRTVSSNDNLALVGKEMGFGELLRRNPNNVQDVTPAMLATAVKAVVGAVWLDSGMSVASVNGILKSMGLM